MPTNYRTATVDTAADPNAESSGTRTLRLVAHDDTRVATDHFGCGFAWIDESDDDAPIGARGDTIDEAVRALRSLYRLAPLALTIALTEAEAIAERFGNDGQQWQDETGRDLSDVCDEQATARRTDGRDRTRWDFADGSSIVAAGAAWDLGLPGGCYCWAEANWGRHADDCTADA